MNHRSGRHEHDDYAHANGHVRRRPSARAKGLLRHPARHLDGSLHPLRLLLHWRVYPSERASQEGPTRSLRNGRQVLQDRDPHHVCCLQCNLLADSVIDLTELCLKFVCRKSDRFGGMKSCLTF